MGLTIGTPCSESWDAMEVQGRGRRCEACDHLVVDFTRMTRDKAEAFVRARAGRRVCGRLFVHPETREAWFPPTEARAPRWSGGLVLAAALTGAGCAGAEQTREPEVVAAAEPRPAPMTPVDELVSASPPPYTGPVPAGELEVPVAPAEPTPEQLQLTSRKRSRGHHGYGHGAPAQPHVTGQPGPTTPGDIRLLEMLGDVAL